MTDKQPYLKQLVVLKVKDPKVNAYRERVAKRSKAELVRLIEQGTILENGTTERLEGQDFFKSFWWDAVRQAVLYRDNYTCQKCGSTNKPLNVHHICPRHAGGSDNPLNLITLCEECHKKVHANDHKKLI